MIYQGSEEIIHFILSINYIFMDLKKIILTQKYHPKTQKKKFLSWKMKLEKSKNQNILNILKIQLDFFVL